VKTPRSMKVIIKVSGVAWGLISFLISAYEKYNFSKEHVNLILTFLQSIGIAAINTIVITLVATGALGFMRFNNEDEENEFTVKVLIFCAVCGGVITIAETVIWPQRGETSIGLVIIGCITIFALVVGYALSLGEAED
jgi:hypothetical protein